MTRNTTRRTFIGQTAAVGTAALVGSRLSRADDSPNQQLTAACVGVGGKGSSDTSHIAVREDIRRAFNFFDRSHEGPCMCTE